MVDPPRIALGLSRCERERWPFTRARSMRGRNRTLVRGFGGHVVPWTRAYTHRSSHRNRESGRPVRGSHSSHPGDNRAASL